MRARFGVAASGVIFLAWGLQSLWLEISAAASMALAGSFELPEAEENSSGRRTSVKEDYRREGRTCVWMV